MAFNKDPRVIARVGTFRQASGRELDRRPERTPKAGAPYYIDMYKPPTLQVDTIRLIEGEYEHPLVIGREPDLEIVSQPLPFYKFTEHYDGKTSKSAICSAGPYMNFRERRDPCAGCDIYWATLEPDKDGRKTSTRMSRQIKYAVSMIDYGAYHHVPQFDVVTEQPRVNPKTNEQYHNWVKCPGFGCDMCAAGLAVKMGHNPHWPMSWGHFQTLRDADRQIQDSCSACGTLNSIKSVAWTCGNKDCGELVIDMKSPNMKMDELIKMTEDNLYECKACGEACFLEEVVQCVACTPKGGHPKRATLFDVDLNVKRVATGQNNQTALSISNWSAPRPIDPAVIPPELTKPKDLSRIFMPTPYAVQCEKFKVEKVKTAVPAKAYAGQHRS